MTLEPIIHDNNYKDFLSPPEGRAFGMTGAKSTHGMKGIQPFNLPLVDPNDLPRLIVEKKQAQSRLSDIRRVMAYGSRAPTQDQNGEGYCWAYSVGGAITLARGRDNQSYKQLSCHGPAAVIKNGRDEGGWCGLSARFAYEYGYPTVNTFPEKSRDLRYYNQACKSEMKDYQVTDGFWDLAKRDYDQSMTKLAVLTCLVANIPCALDFNWWTHSVTGMDAVDSNPSLPATNLNRYGIRIWNYGWTDTWGNLGEGVLVDSRSVPNGAVAIKTITQT